MQPLPHAAARPTRTHPWSAQVGTYALIVASTTTEMLQIGRLGPLLLQAGFYVYLGSAFGPGGVRARLAHHATVAARPHWHIDYVRAVAPLREIWYTYDTIRREHHWATVLQQMLGMSIPLARFGASDCLCPAHFFASPRRPAWPTFRRDAQQAYPAHAPIYRSQLPRLYRATGHCTPDGKRLQA